MITQYKIVATVPTGETGITADSETIHGEILKVSMDVTGNSMDINLDTLGEAKTQAIIDYTGNTDSTFYPRVASTDNAGTTLKYLSTDTATVGVPYAIYGKLRLTLANAAQTETVSMTITVRS
jgi:hypothetical protein